MRILGGVVDQNIVKKDEYEAAQNSPEDRIHQCLEGEGGSDSLNGMTTNSKWPSLV